MAISIGKLPNLSLNYTNKGPGLHLGMVQLEGMLAAERGREGHLSVNVTVKDAILPIVLACSDLYILGFSSGGNWYRFDDADWPFTEAVNKLGYEGQYVKLGGLTGKIRAESIDGIARLANVTKRQEWNESLRNLLVVVSECARLIPVRMQITGLLNGILEEVPLEPLARYIQNWDKASKGKDMSEKVTDTHSVGFRDPTIIKR